MKLWKLTTFLTVSVLTFSGCVGNIPKPSDSPVVDSTLPVVQLTQNGVFTDMQAVAFEWNSVKDDPRVKGIFIYKQELDDKDTEYKYYDTVNNRFVTHYVDNDVDPDTQYGYYFKTYSVDTESKPSQERIVSTLPALESVSWIHAIQEMPRSAKIIWRPHVNQIVKEYILERRTLSEEKWDEIATIKGRLNPEYIDDKLKDNHVYKYRIRVVTYTGIVSEPSAEVKAITKALPKQIHGVVATDELPRKIKINWNPSSDEDFSHYNLYRSWGIDGKFKLIASTKDTEYMDIIKEDGKDYFYRVSAVDKDELESRNDVKSTHGKTLSKPAAPSLVEAKMIGDNLEITWSSTDPKVKNYIVRKSVKKNLFSKISEDFGGIDGNTFVDTAIEPKTTYIYEVYGVDEFSIISEPSIEVKYTTTETQGKVIEKNNVQKDVEVVDSPVETDEQNLVAPIEDLDMSEL